MQLSPPAQDLLALHYQTLSTFTPVQRAALSLEKRAEDVARVKQRSKQDVLYEMIESRATTP